MHDLIEEHYHIRRRYGLPFVHVKRWDRFEPNPEKALPLTTTRRSYPKHVFKLYTSTKYDTSEKRVPWFYWAAIALVVFVVAGGVYAAKRVNSRIEEGTTAGAGGRQQANGAPAKVAQPGGQPAKTRGTAEDYVAAFTPRVPSQPWTAPAYDALAVPNEPPRVFCMVAGPGVDAKGEGRDLSCGCKTDHGTRYDLDFDTCAMIARHGQYEPFLRSPQQQNQQSGPQPVAQAQQARSHRTTVGYEAGQRGDVFPRSPGYPVNSYSPVPTTTL